MKSDCSHEQVSPNETPFFWVTMNKCHAVLNNVTNTPKAQGSFCGRELTTVRYPVAEALELDRL